MDIGKVEKAINLLEEARLRPNSFIGGNDPKLAAVFLNGFNICLILLNLTEEIGFVQKDIRNDLAKKMGAKSTNFIKDFQEMNISDKNIIDILFELEIAAWKKVVELLSSSVKIS